MCEVCKAEGEDTVFKNGNKNAIYKSSLYKVFKDSVADIKLCHVHSIELFTVGEIRFLKEHIVFARALAKRAVRQSESSSYYGF